MYNNQLVSEIENFYLENIYPVCPKLSNCKRNCQSFSKKPKMCYLGKEYGNSPEIPNLVFISLDSGDEYDNLHTISEIRSAVEINPPQFNPGKDIVKHWFQTFDLAKIILSPFIPELIKTDDYYINPYVVHTNSAKCTQNKDGRAMADDILFSNCKEYSIKELELLKPKIVISQGIKAHEVLSCFEEIERIQLNSNNKKLTLSIRKIGENQIIHFSLYHPSYYRGYWGQKEIIINNIDRIKEVIKNII